MPLNIQYSLRTILMVVYSTAIPCGTSYNTRYDILCGTPYNTRYGILCGTSYNTLYDTLYVYLHGTC